MKMLIIIGTSAMVSFVICYSMMKYHLKMTNKILQRFLDEEFERLKKLL